MHFAVLVEIGLLVRVLVPFPIVKVVRVEAGILKWAVALPLVEVHARNFRDVVSVFLHKLLLQITVEDHPSGRYHQVTVFPANRACTEVRLLDLLVVCGAPVPDTVQTESVRAVLE